VLERLFPTLLLAGTALVLASVVGVLLGIVAAVRQNAWQDKVITVVVLIGISTPSFWLGILMIFWFSVRLAWLPVGGMHEMFGGGGLIDTLRHLVLPASVLAAVAGAVLVRLTRGAMLEIMRQDYVRTARAKGLSERRVIFRHAFRNAIVGIIPVIGLEAGYVLGGAVYIETVFQWPGVGRMLVSAISTRDILLVQGGVLIVAAAYVVLNLLADIVQSMLDPRIRQA
jgi:peptide/nickel transport system permease protein